MSDKAHSSRLEHMLDAAVYAPIGFFLTHQETKADLAKVGRKQVAFTRSLGRAALQGLQRQMTTPDDARAAAPPTVTSQSASSDSATSDSATSDSAALANYAELTAREVIAALRTASSATAGWVLATEPLQKQRITVIKAAEAALQRVANEGLS